MIRASTLAFACLAAGLAQAQETEEEIREYTVEVIVFGYDEDVSVGTEQFLPDEPEPVSLMPDFFMMPFPQPEPIPAEEPEEQPDIEENPVLEQIEQAEALFLLSPPELLELSDVKASLERRSTYRPLLHAAWTQQALPEDDALVVKLDKLADKPDNLSGEFTLYLSRFLHLVVDLEFEREGNAGLPVAIEWPGTESVPLTYRINEDRIFRSGETRYYDHPRFGVVAKVTRVELPEPEDDEEASGEQLVN